MSDKELSWRFVEERVSEDVDIDRARHASLEHGIDPITASAGQYIATIATALDATRSWKLAPDWVSEQFG